MAGLFVAGLSSGVILGGMGAFLAERPWLILKGVEHLPHKTLKTEKKNQKRFSFVTASDPTYLTYKIVCLSLFVTGIVLAPIRMVIEYAPIGNDLSFHLEMIFELLLTLGNGVTLVALFAQLWFLRYYFFRQLANVAHLQLAIDILNEDVTNFYLTTSNTWGNLHYFLKVFYSLFVGAWFACVIAIYTIMYQQTFDIEVKMLFSIPRGLTMLVLIANICYLFYTYRRMLVLTINIDHIRQQLKKMIKILSIYTLVVFCDTIFVVLNVFDIYIFDKYYFGAIYLFSIYLLFKAWNTTMVTTTEDWFIDGSNVLDEIVSDSKLPSSKKSRTPQEQQLFEMFENWRSFIQTQEGYTLFLKYLVEKHAAESLMFLTELVQIKHVYRQSHGNVLKLPRIKLKDDQNYDFEWPPFIAKSDNDITNDNELIKRLNSYTKDEWTDDTRYFVYDFRHPYRIANIQSHAARKDMASQLSFVISRNNSNGNSIKQEPSLAATKQSNQDKSIQVITDDNDNKTKENEETFNDIGYREPSSEPQATIEEIKETKDESGNIVFETINSNNKNNNGKHLKSMTSMGSSIQGMESIFGFADKIKSVQTFHNLLDILQVDTSIYGYDNNVTFGYVRPTALINTSLVSLPSGIPVTKILLTNYTLYDQMAALYDRYIVESIQSNTRDKVWNKGGGGTFTVNLPNDTVSKLNNFFNRAKQHIDNLFQIASNADTTADPGTGNDDDNDNNVAPPITATNNINNNNNNDKSRQQSIPRFLFESESKNNNNDNNDNNARLGKDYAGLQNVLRNDIKTIRPTKATDAYISKLNRLAFNIFDDAMITVCNEYLDVDYGSFTLTAEYAKYCRKLWNTAQRNAIQEQDQATNKAEQMAQMKIPASTYHKLQPPY